MKTENISNHDLINTKFVVVVKHAGNWQHSTKIYRIGVVEVLGNFEGEPTMLSTRSKDVISVVKTWEHKKWGKSSRGQAQRAIKEAEELATILTEESQGAATNKIIE